jgi:CheY-like chemotaxis protein
MGRRVLVVDDDPDLREMMAQLLALEGFDASTAANGRDALDRLDAGPIPQVILLDLMMPVMDGQAFRAEQRADPALASIPVVVVSAYRDVERYADELAAECLAKPVRLDTLLATARRHCTAA